jgi:hypothetical protein
VHGGSDVVPGSGTPSPSRRDTSSSSLPSVRRSATAAARVYLRRQTCHPTTFFLYTFSPNILQLADPNHGSLQFHTQVRATDKKWDELGSHGRTELASHRVSFTSSIAADVGRALSPGRRFDVDSRIAVEPTTTLHKYCRCDQLANTCAPRENQPTLATVDCFLFTTNSAQIFLLLPQSSAPPAYKWMYYMYMTNCHARTFSGRTYRSRPADRRKWRDKIH